jgi:hypothetical protein
MRASHHHVRCSCVPQIDHLPIRGPPAFIPTIPTLHAASFDRMAGYTRHDSAHAAGRPQAAGATSPHASSTEVSPPRLHHRFIVCAKSSRGGWLRNSDVGASICSFPRVSAARRSTSDSCATATWSLPPAPQRTSPFFRYKKENGAFSAKNVSLETSECPRTRASEESLLCCVDGSLSVSRGVCASGAPWLRPRHAAWWRG